MTITLGPFTHQRAIKLAPVWRPKDLVVQFVGTIRVYPAYEEYKVVANV